MVVEIPLFPLGVVLFPHMPLPLHIFEERYRAMMQDCQEQGIGFGVVAIREGTEVGRPSTPYRVGTLAQIRRKERLDDGRWNVLVVGATRYRIDRISATRPYLVAEVEYLADEPGDEAAGVRLAHHVAEAFQRYGATLRSLVDEEPTELDLPEDPELLSYLVSATLQVETRHKQHLLETDSAPARLRSCLALLRREAVLLDQRLTKRELPIAPISAN